MKNITKDEIKFIPEITQFVLNGIWQFDLSNEQEVNNVRIWAMQNNCTQEVCFVWQGHQIHMNESGDLTKFPLGWLDKTQIQLVEMIKIRRGKI